MEHPEEIKLLLNEPGAILPRIILAPLNQVADSRGDDPFLSCLFAKGNPRIVSIIV